VEPKFEVDDKHPRRSLCVLVAKNMEFSKGKAKALFVLRTFDGFCFKKTRLLFTGGMT
jgi:hypothetical protein